MYTFTDGRCYAEYLFSFEKIKYALLRWLAKVTKNTNFRKGVWVHTFYDSSL